MIARHFMIRKATVRDVKAIHGLLKEHADQGELLPRPLSEIYDSLRDFSVFEEKSDGCLSGICALHICWEDLAEVRSLVVKEEFRRRGIGSALVSAAIAEARGFGIGRVFALTYRQDFFGQQGFEIIDKGLLPQKIWTDCLKCVKFPDCDETAMLKVLEKEEHK